MGGDAGKKRSNPADKDFNSHPRVGGDLCSAAGVGNSSNFNSHPRVGGDLSHNCRLRGLPISIRTPAWGVTRILEYIGIRKMISIRTPAWGVTGISASLVNRRNFNSHPRVGGDLPKDTPEEELLISIRTPAWGVTFGMSSFCPNYGISIRTPAWGVTSREK